MTLMTAEKKEVRFEDLRLLPGQALQLEIEGYTNDRDRSVLVGYRAGQGLIVTTPLVNGTPMSLKLGTPLNVRLFATQMNCACAFHTEVVHIARAPYPHMHLAQPTSLVLGEVRASVRARVNLIASLHYGQDLQQKTSARIRDLSLGGARVLPRSEPALLAVVPVAGQHHLGAQAQQAPPEHERAAVVPHVAVQRGLFGIRMRVGHTGACSSAPRNSLRALLP